MPQAPTIEAGRQDRDQTQRPDSVWKWFIRKERFAVRELRKSASEEHRGCETRNEKNRDRQTPRDGVSCGEDDLRFGRLEDAKKARPKAN
jgi:hypothetical protein